MSSMEDETQAFVQSADDESADDCGGEALFGCYTVLAPGVQIVLDGRPVSAPAPD